MIPLLYVTGSENESECLLVAAGAVLQHSIALPLIDMLKASMPNSTQKRNRRALLQVWLNAVGQLYREQE